MSSWGDKKKKSLRKIEGTRRFLTQVALLRFYKSKELTFVLVMNKYPNI